MQPAYQQLIPRKPTGAQGIESMCDPALYREPNSRERAAILTSRDRVRRRDRHTELSLRIYRDLLPRGFFRDLPLAAAEALIDNALDDDHDGHHRVDTLRHSNRIWLESEERELMRLAQAEAV